MGRTSLLRPGTFTSILAKEPLCDMYVPIIPGDPSADCGFQDDTSLSLHVVTDSTSHG